MSNLLNKIKTKINNLNHKHIFVICLTCIVIFSTISPFSVNDRSRYLSILSIANNHTLIIDHELQKADTIDKIMINNHYYSDKPPLFAITFSPIYLIAKKMKISVYNKYLYKFSIILIMGLFFAYAMSLFFKECEIYLPNHKWLLSLLIFTTPYYVFNRVLISHALVGSLLYIAFYYIRKKDNIFLIMLAGLFSGLAVAYDHGAIFIFLGFLCYIFFIKDFKKMAYIILFSLIPILIHTVIVYKLSGSILPLNLHREFFNYPNSPWYDSNGLTGTFKHPTILSFIGYVLALLFILPNCPAKGLFLITPILLFAFIQIFKDTRSKSQNIRFEAVSLLIGISLLILYYALFSNNLGGGDYMVRWFIIFMPLCLPYIARSYSLLYEKMKWKGWFYFALCSSLYFSIVHSFFAPTGGLTPLF